MSGSYRVRAVSLPAVKTKPKKDISGAAALVRAALDEFTGEFGYRGGRKGVV